MQDLHVACPALLALTFLLAASGCGAPEPTPEQRARTDSLAALPPLERLPDDEAGELIRRAIRAHGGWDAWSALRSVEYRKVTVQLDDRGRPADSTVERHRYALDPGPRMRIDRLEEGEESSVVLINDGDEAWKLDGGEVDRGWGATDEARNSTFGSHYVFSQPFKLTDAGARFTALGRDTLPEGIPVDAVRVRYDPGVGSSGGMHTWVYYFDPETGRLAGYRFGEGDEVESDRFTVYGDFRQVGGVVLYGRRTAYEVGADGPRPATVYRHEDHRADPAVPDSLFLPPARRPSAGGS